MQLRFCYGRLIAILLFIAASVAGCGQSQPTPQTPVVQVGEPQTAAQVTQTPTQATQTAGPTATPLPTQPAPQESPAAPTASAGQTLLPPDAPWILTSNRIIALAPGSPQLDLPAKLLPDPSSGSRLEDFTIARNGSRIAYVEDNAPEIVVVDPASGETQRFPQGDKGSWIWSPRLSPDGRLLAFAIGNDKIGVRWELRLLDLESGAVQVAQYTPYRGPLVPVAWTEQGLIAELILYATDAPPKGLFLIDPEGGAVQQLSEMFHLQAFATSAGTRFALIEGTWNIGEPPQHSLMVFNLTGVATQIAPKQAGQIEPVRWSPDESRLLYARSPHYNQKVPARWLYIVPADGTNEQMLDLTSLQFGGSCKTRIGSTMRRCCCFLPVTTGVFTSTRCLQMISTPTV